jgi:hypothetical protein
MFAWDLEWFSVRHFEGAENSLKMQRQGKKGV